MIRQYIRAQGDEDKRLNQMNADVPPSAGPFNWRRVSGRTAALSGPQPQGLLLLLHSTSSVVRLHAFVRHGLGQQGTRLIRNSSSTPLFATPVSDAFIRPDAAYFVTIRW